MSTPIMILGESGMPAVMSLRKRAMWLRASKNLFNNSLREHALPNTSRELEEASWRCLLRWASGEEDLNFPKG